MEQVKRIMRIAGKENFFLGRSDDTNYYLEEATYNCQHYWGFGYIQGYYKGKWQSHQHFKGLIEWQKLPTLPFMEETPLTVDERWDLVELMQRFYTLKKFTELVYNSNGAHVTGSGLNSSMRSAAYYHAAQTALRKTLPDIFSEIYHILTPADVATPVVRYPKYWGDWAMPGEADYSDKTRIQLEA